MKTINPKYFPFETIEEVRGYQNPPRNVSLGLLFMMIKFAEAHPEIPMKIKNNELKCDRCPTVFPAMLPTFLKIHGEEIICFPCWYKLNGITPQMAHERIMGGKPDVVVNGTKFRTKQEENKIQIQHQTRLAV